MDSREAIFAFSQSEKAKAALIMASQMIEIYNGLPEHEKHCAERFIRAFLGMITSEIQLARKLTSPGVWDPVDKSLNAELPTNPEILKQAFAENPKFWIDNGDKLAERWTKWAGTK
jgi:hypothetical protein